MLNKITVMGRLTKDPDIRYTQNQKTVASWTLAIDRDYQSGGTERQTDFVNCLIWNQGACLRLCKLQCIRRGSCQRVSCSRYPCHHQRNRRCIP